MPLADAASQADAKLHAQGAALRRVLADELRECIRSGISPRIDRALEEALGQLDKAVCSGIEHMNFETARSSDLVNTMAERLEQASTASIRMCVYMLLTHNCRCYLF